MINNNFYIQQIELGDMRNYVYLIGDLTTKEAAIIDPGWDVGFLRQAALKAGLKITALLVTHDHPDHTNGIEAFYRQEKLPIYLGAREHTVFFPADCDFRLLTDGETFKIGLQEIQCVETPGHTPGGVCYLVAGNLFTGDTLFMNCCGRCDLPSSDPKAMFKSLQKIKAMPDELLIYPGHNYHAWKKAQLSDLKKINPVLKYATEEAFLKS